MSPSRRGAPLLLLALVSLPARAVHADTGDGTLNPNQVAHVVYTNLGGIQACYNMALVDEPTLQGRLDVRFTIGPLGTVTGRPHATGLNLEVRTCIENVVARFLFPRPQGGSVDFSYGFNFTPGR